MFIFSESQNCFKVREVSEDSGDFERMIQGMQDRGVVVEVLDTEGSEKRFCFR